MRNFLHYRDYWITRFLIIVPFCIGHFWTAFGSCNAPAKIIFKRLLRLRALYYYMTCCAFRKEEFIRSVKRDLANRVATIVVSHPFHVITIRMMAQFIGREAKYSGLFSSIGEIYRQNGILGFFSGLVPRILGDVISLVVASLLTYLVNTYILEEKDLQIYSSATMSFIATAITYPFQVVSNCMAVTNSGLMAGTPPQMSIYNSWIDCWTDLSKQNQLKRGSSLLVRYYTGPQVSIGGRLVPIPQDLPKLN